MHSKLISAGVITASLVGLAPLASAQSTYWSYGGGNSYASYEACEQARRTRTVGGAAIGGLLGAGLGALAGGDDTRNAVVGGVVGAAAGGTIGSNQVKCTPYS